MDRETDRWVRSDEARAKLRDLLDEVNGAHSFIYILRYDRPEAVLVPVEWFEAVKARLEGREPPPGVRSYRLEAEGGETDT